MSLRNNPSHVLTKIDNMFVTAVLGPDRISMCTAYAQIYVASEEQDWLIVGTGPLCLAHDFQQNTFILILIDSNCNKVVWESELTHCTEYLCVSDKFHLLRLDQLTGVNFICTFEAQHFQCKLNGIIKYINTTHLVVNTDINSIQKSQKCFEIKPKVTDIVIKPDRPRSPIIRGKSCFKKCYRKLVNSNNNNMKIEKQRSFKSVSVPTSPTCKDEEKIYQTLSDIRQLQIRYSPCFA